MFRFEKLDVWQEALTLAKDVYAVTNQFPESERFGLMSQIRRAAVSIPANIAEGTSRTTDKDFARFVEIAYGSLMETISHAFVARNQQFLKPEDFERVYANGEKLARMLSGLRSSLLNNK